VLCSSMARGRAPAAAIPAAGARAGTPRLGRPPGSGQRERMSALPRVPAHHGAPSTPPPSRRRRRGADTQAPAASPSKPLWAPSPRRAAPGAPPARLHRRASPGRARPVLRWVSPATQPPPLGKGQQGALQTWRPAARALAGPRRRARARPRRPTWPACSQRCGAWRRWRWRSRRTRARPGGRAPAVAAVLAARAALWGVLTRHGNVQRFNEAAVLYQLRQGCCATRRPPCPHVAHAAVSAHTCHAAERCISGRPYGLRGCADEDNACCHKRAQLGFADSACAGGSSWRSRSRRKRCERAHERARRLGGGCIRAAEGLGLASCRRWTAASQACLQAKCGELAAQRQVSQMPEYRRPASMRACCTQLAVAGALGCSCMQLMSTGHACLLTYNRVRTM